MPMGPWPDQPVNLPRTPSVEERVLSRTRHPSFTAEVAELVTEPLSRRQLLRLWDETTRLLAQAPPAALRLNLVVLRDHVLRRLEAIEPGSLEGFLRRGRPPGLRVRRPRGRRS